MVWKNGKTGFHGVEVFPKLASMAWKNAENGFHGVEVFAPQRKTTTPRQGRPGEIGTMRKASASMAPMLARLDILPQRRRVRDGCDDFAPQNPR